MNPTQENAVATTVQADLAPTQEEIALLTRQYQKALDGLFEAYQFGMMLRAVKERLDAADGAGACAAPTPPAEAQGASPRPAPVGAGVEAPITENQILVCESARGPAKIEDELRGGWNRGTGLKAWLARYCPEINYSTAKRFLAVAEKTVAALALADEAEASEAAAVGSASPASPESWGEAPCASAGEGARSPFPPEAKVRAFLAGKSQRAVLRLGGKREGAGRKAKDWAAALEASPEVAWKEIEEPLGRLSRLIVRERRHAVLTAVDLATLRDAIDLLHEVVHADA